MPIYCTTRSIFDIKACAYVNPVNTDGIMGAGLAKKFKEKYPEMEASYVKWCRTLPQRKMQTNTNIDTDLDIHTWKNPNPLPKYIFNFPTKIHWWEPSSYPLIDKGLDSLLWILAAKPDVFSIAIPALGCGLGGLNFASVAYKIYKAMREFDDLTTYIIFHPIKSTAPVDSDFDHDWFRQFDAKKNKAKNNNEDTWKLDI